MLTAGDIEFEPNVKKIRYFTSSCAAMIAGDANLQSEIVQAVQLAMKERIESATDWIPISEIARTYKREVDNSIRRIVEDRILAPFGLTMQEFVKNWRINMPKKNAASKASQTVLGRKSMLSSKASSTSLQRLQPTRLQYPPLQTEIHPMLSKRLPAKRSACLTPEVQP
jgi:hypothetical protein